MRRLLQPLSLALLLALPSFHASAIAQEPAPAAPAAPAFPDLPLVPEALRHPLMQGDLPRSLELLDGFAAAEPAAADLWLYLRGLALARAKQSRPALEIFQQLEREHPDSAWEAKARFHRAELHALLGEWNAAEKVWEDAARHLRSSERQGELAAIYLRLAGELSTPPSQAQPDAPALDYGRAAALYARVLDLEAPAAAREQARYRHAWCLEQLGRWNDAIGAYMAYLGDFEGSGARTFEARFRLGECLRQGGRPADARRSYEDLDAALVAAIAGAADPVRRAELELLAGDAAFGRTRTFDESARESRRAIDALSSFLERFPDHPQAPAAAMEKAERAMRRGWDEEALAAFAAFLARPPRAAATDLEREAEARLRQRALFQRGMVLRRQGRFAEAIAVFADYAGRYPTGPDWAAAQQGMVDAEYAIGAACRERNEWQAARTAWDAFLLAHPLDGRVPQIMLDLGELHASEAAAAESGDPARAPAFQAAIEQWRKVVEKYPGSDQASKAFFRIGQVQEMELLQLEEAVAAYRACDFGPWSTPARERLVVMTRPSLALVTPRTWRGDEEAKVTLQTRNVDAVQVEIYALDLEAYFRKHLTNRSIEELDLDLIEPDHSFAHPVAGAADYLPVQGEIVLPVEGPGVWAVATTAGRLRATTLVVRSDLDVIVKSSRREVFVFAQDMRRQEPAAGAAVLLALPGAGGGPAEFHELRTGADGVARLSLDRLRDADWLRLFAVREGHCAAQGLELGGLALASGLTPRGLAYTDRPAYRPGQPVNWRAILRRVDNGAYAVRAGETMRWSVFDARGRLLRAGEAAVSEFGTAHGDFELPASAPVGRYLLRFDAAEDLDFTASFQVADYKLPKIQLALEPAQAVVFRGEDVVLAASATWAYGEPLRGASLVVDFPDGRSETFVTDQDGKAEARFATRELAEEQVLSFRATLPEEGAGAMAQVHLAVSEFAISIALRRQVVLAGESFPVTLRTIGATGEPTGRKLRLEVLRIVQRGATWSETRERTLDAETSAADGSAQLVLALEAGGNYTLRAFGEDRFGNTIVADVAVFVSGEEDETKLRVLADRTRLEVGETLRAQVVNRAGEGLALITFEGETILDYRVVRLGQGANALALEIGHQHFPNFTLAAAMMRGESFHEARADFAVQRELRVAIEPEREVYAPGELAYVGLAVTDQLGRPVAAELSLGVVDATLYDLFPDRTPSLRAFFEQGTEREAGLRSASSYPFRYDGVTREIAAAVLEEAERELAEEEWNADAEALRGLLARTVRGPGDSVPPGGRPAATPATTAAQSADKLGQLRELGYVAEDEGEWNEDVGFGGGAGGRLRGGRGGRGGGQAPELEGSEADTLFWTPAVVTDEQGRARVRFAVPSRSTRWRLTARGVGEGTLLGEQRVEILSRAEFFVELRAPAALTEGDRPRFVARVHNLGGLTGEAELSLRVGTGDGAQLLPGRLAIAPGEVAEYVFPAVDPLVTVPSGRLHLALEGAADFGDSTLRHGVQLELPLRPWGVAMAASASGELGSRERIELALPAGPRYRDGRIELFVGHDLGRILVAEALGEDALPAPRAWAQQIAPTRADLASELLGAAAVLEQLQRAGRVAAPEFAELRARAEGLTAALIAAQLEGGAWAWGGDGTASPQTSAEAMIALAQAKAAGVGVDPGVVEKGLRYLDSAFRAAREQASELKAMIVHAMARHRAGDFAAANRLHRERAGLAPAALAHTALALAAMERKSMAAEIAQLLADKIDAGQGRCSVAGNDAWSRSPIEMTALALLAIQSALPAAPAAERAAAHLLASRPWYPPRARGWAVAALAQRRGAVEPERERLELVVRIGAGEARRFELGPDAAGVELSEALPEGSDRVVVELELRGRGRPHYAAVLRGFSPKVEARKEQRFWIWRSVYLAAAPRYRGQVIPTGFDVLADHGDIWENKRSELAQGESLQGQIDFSRVYARGESAEEQDFLQLEIPLPAGARVLEDSVSGDLQSWEQRDGVLVAQIGPHTAGTIRYEMVGVVPGEYRVLPAALRSAYDPELLALSAPMQLRVLERGAAASDSYRPTPDELFHLGSRRYAQGEHAEAWQALAPLVDEFGPRLREDRLREAATLLLYLAIERADARAIVRYFEVLKEKDPELTVSFERVLAIGEAYRRLEEHERALLIFRAVVEETFGKDLKVAGALQESGQTAEALAVMERLGREFPDLPSVIAAELALSDELLTRAAGARSDPSLKRAGLDRARLSLRGISLLRLFLVLYADDPVAPDAGLNLVSAYLGLEDYETAAALAGELAGLFRKPEYADALNYTRAVAEWYVGREEEALRLLAEIAAAEYPDGAGGTRPSPNRDLALYILGQIHHARRDLARAAEYYARVEAQFRDARDALADLREKHIALPEVTSARPGEAVRLALEFRNVKQAELLVYAVDLMKLYLREKDLSHVTEVNLAGIAPAWRQSIELGAGSDLLPRDRELALPLKEPGAYLVICRGDELHASGLVLVSDLELRVKEDAVAGSLRVQALAGADQRFLRDVDVRVVGSASGEFRAGRTDPRGLFVADGVAGTATVIARMEGGHYAFHRGTLILGELAQHVRREQIGAQELLDGVGGEDYLQNVQQLNFQNQVERRQRLQEEMQRERKGVQVKAVK